MDRNISKLSCYLRLDYIYLKPSVFPLSSLGTYRDYGYDYLFGYYRDYHPSTEEAGVLRAPLFQLPDDGRRDAEMDDEEGYIL